ncbi:Predicted nucleotidyltransferase [Desulfacinum infernum DSM 9756]|uniref:Predicted nucleotidyltransferase n=1 Tax=Desulfacinum infernum DSM 9756 TaxID=1121391 RepID=A0A1M4ZLK1_9BACT|nr:nucleotidyltransferase domain-containing protein [Desulfacinum infernum]SHF18891.1 Predicted nucleotidyltransferase [Desulfacinum infernum DSM 9756]
MGAVDRIAEAVRPLAERTPEVTAVYVFGSTATGRATDKSDVDLAVLLHPDPGPAFDLLGFGVEAEKVLGKSVDVVVLNRAGEHLKYLVRRDGILIYDRDPQARRRFDRWSRKAYQDFLHYHRRYVQKMKEQLRRG